MTQLTTGPFNAMNFDPELGIPQLPLGLKQPARLVSDEVVGAKSNTSSGMLVFTLEIIDGPNKGAQGVYRLNIYNQNEKTVEIAYRQLSALSIACQTPHWNDTRELYNKPFLIDVTPQKATEANEGKGYTEVSAVYDINGNKPTRQGATGGANQQQNNQQQNTQQNNGGGNGGWPANNNGNNNNQSQNNQQQDNSQQQNNGNGNGNGNWPTNNNNGNNGQQDQQQNNNGNNNNGGGTPPWMQK